MIGAVVTRARSKWRASTGWERAYFAALAAVVAWGALLRSARFWLDPVALWGDEAMWAARMLSQPLLSPSFRPLGFMALCTGLAELLSVDERVLRLPSYAASLASLLLLFRLGHRVLSGVGTPLAPRRACVLLMMTVAALHPMLVDFAREFKPYSLELFVHLLLLDRYLAYRDSGTHTDLLRLLVLAPLSFFFAYNAIFAFPTLYGLLMIEMLSRRAWRRMTAVVASALSGLLSIVLLYLLIFRSIPEGEDDSSFWGKKYGVFFLDDHGGSQVRWEIDKLLEVAAFPGAGRLFWDKSSALSDRALRELAGVESLAWIVLFVAGATLLWRRRELWALFLVPVATVMVFNVVGLWPWGAFRTNLFVLAYVFCLPFVTLARIAQHSQRALTATLVAGSILFVVPTVAFGLGVRAEKRAWTGHSEFPRIVERIVSERRVTLQRQPAAPREVILLDAYTCEVYQFYLAHHEPTQSQYGDFLREHFEWKCIYGVGRTARAVAQRKGRSTWVVVSKRTLVEPTLAAVSKAGRVVVEERPSYNHLLVKISGPAANGAGTAP